MGPARVDVAMQTCDRANWADTDPRRRLRGAQAKDKWAKRIGPTGKWARVLGKHKGTS